MEVPRLGVESELQLPAYTTVTPDLSRICDVHHSSQQHQILNPLSKARDGTHLLMDTSWVCYCWSHNGNSLKKFLSRKIRDSQKLQKEKKKRETKFFEVDRIFYFFSPQIDVLHSLVQYPNKEMDINSMNKT